MGGATLHLARPDGQGWVRLGVVDGLTGFHLEEDPDDTAAVIDVMRGGTITVTVKLTPAQAHEWGWWMRSLHRHSRRPNVTGPRPLAYGCLPKRGRRR